MKFCVIVTPLGVTSRRPLLPFSKRKSKLVLNLLHQKRKLFFRYWQFYGRKRNPSFFIKSNFYCHVDHDSSGLSGPMRFVVFFYLLIEILGKNCVYIYHDNFPSHHLKLIIYYHSRRYCVQTKFIVGIGTWFMPRNKTKDE